MKKRILSIFIVFVMCLTLIPTVALADDHTTHADGCPGHDIVFTEWTSTNSLPIESGSWYLTNDVTFNDSRWEIPIGKTINLCLNGHVIKLDGTMSGNNNISINLGATLNLYDCGTATHKFTVGADGLWTLSESATENYETVTGGCITGGNNGTGGAIYLSWSNDAGETGATLNMYGGNIVGNKSTGLGGGAVYVDRPSTFNMSGGKIIGNIATKNGGAVYLHTENTGRNVTFNMSGGEIRDNKATEFGGGVYVESNIGTFNMSGGTISGCSAQKGGGVFTYGTMTMSGNGEIRDCTATIDGGGVCACNCAFSMTGDSVVSNCVADNGGGGVYTWAGTNETASFTMSGASKIEKCVAKYTDTSNRRSGGGLCVENSTFTMTGGEITNNTSAADGGGVCFMSGTATLGGTAKITDNVKGGTITNGALSGGTTNNLYLFNEETVTLGNGTNGAAAPASGMSVSVTTQTAPTSNNIAITGNGTAATQDHVKYFFSDNANYHVAYEDNALKLVSGSNWKLLNDALSANSPTSVPGVFNVNGTDITLLTDIVAGTSDTTLTVPTGKTVTLRLEEHTIDRNLTETASNGGSVIQVESGATLNILGTGTITGGKTTNNGGGINNSGTLTLYGGTIDGNLAAAYGGGIYNNGGTVTVGLYARTEIKNNTAYMYGGGIYNNGGSITLFSSVIENNKATGYDGGGIYTTSYVNLRNSTTIQNCQANLGGGVYVANNGWVENDGGKITGNTATNGGGVYIEHGGTATFGNNASVKNCTAAEDGGGIYSKGAVGLETAAISDNTVTNGNGGGIYLSGGETDAEKGSIFLGKNANVTGNKKGEAANNLYLCDQILLAKFGVAEDYDVPAPTSGMKIGVTTQTAPTSGNPVPIITSAKDTYKEYIVSDNANYEVKFDTGHLELAVKAAPPAPSSGSTPTVTVPVSGDKDSVKVQATVSGSNATIKNVTAEQLDKVGTGENVTIDLSSLSKSVSGVTIPKTTLENVATSEASGLEVKLPNGTGVVLDKTAIAAVAEQAGGSNIQLVVDKDAKAEKALTAAQKETVKTFNDALVLDAYFVSNGKRISDFKGGEADLTIAYLTTKPVRVWYVAEDGTKELVPSTFDGKNTYFTVEHFSHYVIEILDGSSYASCPQDETCVYAKFTDTDTKAWYHDGVHFCVENGYMQGVSVNKFDPSGTLSRGMIVTMLWRMEGEPVVNYAMSFKDVADGQWYTEAIRWAQSTGVVDGYSADSFGPNDDVTREQLAAILYNYAKLKGQGFTGSWMFLLDFADRTSISSWADEAVHWCSMKGIVNGKTENGNKVFDPQGKATRAEAAAMVQRFCEAVSTEE